MKKTNDNYFTCISGGAIGSDYFWGKYALENGFYLKHFYINNDKTPYGNHSIMLGSTKAIDKFLSFINDKYLNRKFPMKNNYVNNLIRRNYYIIKNSEIVFAVSELMDDGITIKGGTGWGISIARELKKDIYFFEQKIGKWLEFSYIKKSWIDFSYENDPRLFCFNSNVKLNFAGIGTREIKPNGIDAIKKFYEDLWIIPK